MPALNEIIKFTEEARVAMSNSADNIMNILEDALIDSGFAESIDEVETQSKLDEFIPIAYITIWVVPNEMTTERNLRRVLGSKLKKFAFMYDMPNDNRKIIFISALGNAESFKPK